MLKHYNNGIIKIIKLQSTENQWFIETYEFTNVLRTLKRIITSDQPSSTYANDGKPIGMNETDFDSSI